MSLLLRVGTVATRRFTGVKAGKSSGLILISLKDATLSSRNFFVTNKDVRCSQN